ncbi:MAG: response regulator [Armatimonadia bacterium]|nr:response regulator [Armatimonadia bacterium]
MLTEVQAMHQQSHPHLSPELGSDCHALAHGPSLDVLLVEDDPALRRVLSEVLRVYGHRAVEAATAAEAMRRLRCQRFHALVTDYNLGTTNGLELVLDASRVQSGLRSVLATGQRLTVDEAAQLRACGAGLLRKPFVPTELMTAIGAKPV